MLTVAYVTNRAQPMLEWFLESLQNELAQHEYHNGFFEVIVVSKEQLVTPVFPQISDDSFVLNNYKGKHYKFNIRFVEPKPSVWQGRYRLTKQDFFDASGARNSALCHAQDGHILFLDDLSVLMPGFMSAVLQHMQSDKIALGAYRKVKELVVENGLVKSFTPSLNEKGIDVGIDSRWNHGSDVPVVAAGSWLFGCSLLAPVDALIKVGGWPEAICGGMGSEDSIMGIMLQNSGNQFVYDRRMLTYESEEHHHFGTVMRRDDKGISPNDKSHAALNMALGGMKFHPNHFGDEGIIGLRKRILAGEAFPIPKIPQHDWYDGQPLSEM
jgi:hypothetical protein